MSSCFVPKPRKIMRCTPLEDGATVCERGIGANFRCRPLVARRRLRDGQLLLFLSRSANLGKANRFVVTGLARQ